MKITAVVLTKNEEKHIQKCLSNLKWVDEVIIVDDNSTDKTVEIAAKDGVKIYKRDLVGDFAAQRNFGLSKASNDWVLFIDADEQVTSKLADEIEALDLLNADTLAYSINRVDYLWGKQLKYGDVKNVWLDRKSTRLNSSHIPLSRMPSSA